ncbi:MAG TPA: HD domain-containing protein [Syntrophobacter fumaroxidans]|nr:HD domain-containing protein [Syntrophobacter fumaroxidans]
MQAPKSANASRIRMMLPSTADVHGFDLEHYRARMSKFLDPAESDNRVFYDALQYAYDLHKGQTRKSGAPYISHPCSVAEILARELHFRDPHLLAAALLHDVVEDIPGITLEDILRRFGSRIAELVDGCTKLTRHQLDRAALKDLTHSKIFLSASRRLGVLIIKLVDRLHNLRTLHYLPQAKRQRIAQETVEVYAPIAARFNIYPLKRELYHLALSYLYPRKSKKILQHVRELRSSAEVVDIENRLREILLQAGVAADIRPRPKGLGSYYNALKRTLDIGNPENYFDFAVVLATGEDLKCYLVLGIICKDFVSIPRSLRDFIANPKINGYRSLHVRVHVGGQNYLIKIRTEEMDLQASYGVLQDWTAQTPMSDDHWAEISDLLRTIGEYGGAGAQRKELIRLSEAEEIFVYSPQGDIYYLPKGSVVLDFAYKIHSELGDHCQGALVNGLWEPPTRVLKDAETVEIITSPDLLDVDPDLEQLCKTPRARSFLNRHLQHRRQHFAREIGRQVLSQELRRHGYGPDALDDETVSLLLEVINLKDISDLYTRLGQDLLSPELVLYYLEAPLHAKDRHPHHSPHSLDERNAILVSELDKAFHKFARCCNPYPGQENVLATISERGTTFHHPRCEDLKSRHGLQPQHLLDVCWDFDGAWRHVLVFQLHIQQQSISDLLPLLVRMPSTVRIRYIESVIGKHNEPTVRLSVALHSFAEARELFRILPEDRVSIDEYGRQGTSARVHAECPYVPDRAR